jgi:pantetheine-phosphate adenylyltransferase
MTQKSHIALYPGTFDGLTWGHLDIIRRGAHLFDKLYVAVAQNNEKSPLLSAEERVAVLREETADLENVEVTAFIGLTMEYAEQLGIRVVSDFEAELQMALMNRALNPRVETLFMFPSAEYLYVSSSLIKEVLLLGGEVGKFVPPASERLLREKLAMPAPR